MRVRIIFLLLAHTCYGAVANDDGIQVRIRVVGKPMWASAYVSVFSGESITLICDLINVNNSVIEDRLEWTKTLIPSTVKREFSRTYRFRDNVGIPMDSKQKENRYVVNLTSLSESDTGIYKCKSKKYAKSAITLVYVKSDQFNTFGSGDKLSESTRNMAGAKDKPIVNKGGVTDASAANWKNLTDHMNKVISNFLKPPPLICFYRGFKCVSDYKCIKFHKVCDGTWDCDDGSDESVQECVTGPCARKTRCDDGRCVSRDACAFHSSLCCQEYSKPDEYTYRRKSAANNSRQILLYLACVVCVIQLIMVLIYRTCRAKRASPDRAMLPQLIVIHGPATVGDALERGEANSTAQSISDGVSREGMPLNRGGASSWGEEPCKGLPAYEDVVATETPPPSYASAIANAV